MVEKTVDDVLDDMIEELVTKVCEIIIQPIFKRLTSKYRIIVLNYLYYFLFFQLTSVLESVLNKFSRYDDGAFIASMLSITVNF